MVHSQLIAFWIQGPEPAGPVGYGVTGYSLKDAFEIVRRAGYTLPTDTSALRIQADVKVSDLEYDYVRDHMGAIVVRGLWYPFIRVGLGAHDEMA